MADAPAETVPYMKMQHALFLLGTEHLFLVHMTNFNFDCHRYQAVFRVEIPAHVRETYFDDRARHPTDWYVVGNTEQDLLNLTEIQRGARTSFRGSLWRCMPERMGSEHWPWKGAPTVAEDFEVEIVRTVYFRRFDFNLNPPNTATYILFGEGSEAHLDHYQVKEPEYDHVLTLSEAPAWLPKELLEAGIPVNFPDIPATPGGALAAGAVHCTDPIPAGTHYVQYGGLGPGRPITVERTVWFCTQIVNSAPPCPDGPTDPCSQLPAE